MCDNERVDVKNFVAESFKSSNLVGSDIVVTATSSRQPIVMNDWVAPGTHINCIGADAPGKQELDPAILKRARVIIDDWEQASHSGEINVPLTKGEITKDDVDAEIGEVVAGLKPGRLSESDVTVFCSTGLAVQDSLTAKIAYDAAVRDRVGRSPDPAQIRARAGRPGVWKSRSGALPCAPSAGVLSERRRPQGAEMRQLSIEVLPFVI